MGCCWLKFPPLFVVSVLDRLPIPAFIRSLRFRQAAEARAAVVDVLFALADSI